MTKGLICIDIDGTLTAVRDRLSPHVTAYLQECVKEGFSLLFVTGRTFSWSMHLLHTLPIGYVLGALNGAYIAQLPEQTVIARHAVSHAALVNTCQQALRYDVGLIFCGSPDRNEESFFLDRFCSEPLKKHLTVRRVALKENWIRTDEIPEGGFSALRIFCVPEVAKKLAREISETASLQAALMKDSYDAAFWIVQVTHDMASKGHAAKAVAKFLGNQGPLIACGDDHNDIPMFQIADCSIVMKTAPEEVRAFADIVAPPAREDGLIQGLKCAKKLLF